MGGRIFVLMILTLLPDLLRYFGFSLSKYGITATQSLDVSHETRYYGPLKKH